MNILLITYYFSPSGAIGAKRWSGFYNISKNYCDVNFTVLTANWKGEKYNNQNIHYLGDEVEYIPPKSINKEYSFLDILKHPTIVMRSVDRSLFDSWIQDVKKWINYNSSLKFDFIIASYGPMSSVILGDYAKKIYKVPFILDMRDLISIQGQKIKTPIFNFIDNMVDKFFTRNVDRFLVVSPTCKKKAEVFYKRPVHTIYNGLENKIEEEYIDLSIRNKKKVVILYAGTLGKNRNPNKVLTILNKYVSMKQDLAVEVRFASQDNPFDFVNLNDISNIKVKWLGYISKTELEKEKEKSDVFLLLEDLSEKGNENLTGKIFEYLSSKKLIMASCNINSDINWVLNETNAGMVIRDIDDCKTFFSEQRIVNVEKINFFTREVQFNELLKVIKNV